MLAALFVTVVLGLDVCSTCASTGRDVKLCEPHAALERATLDREKSGLKSKEPAAAVAALDAIAALTAPHANAPSPKVAQTIATGLGHESATVRRRAAELLGPPQHADVALDALVRALADTQKQAARLRTEMKALDTQLATKQTDKRRETLTAEHKSCVEETRQLSEWRRTLTARLAVFPDDRAVDAILDCTQRNLVLESDVALVQLGNKKALRALKESIEKGDLNLADLEKELAAREAERKNKPMTLGRALEERAVDQVRERLSSARRELAAAFAERKLTAPPPEADSATWTTWIDANLAAFPDSLPGVARAAW
jgi:hypothetical protein